MESFGSYWSKIKDEDVWGESKEDCSICDKPNLYNSYKHCDKCNKCVFLKLQHCDVCNKCVEKKITFILRYL